jgi:MOSC domain-containing protein YiiM
MDASVISVNVATVQTVAHNGKPLRTAIGKRPVAGPVDVHALSLAGDQQADHRYHGGPDRAIYAYASEDYDWWSERVGRPLAPGLFGENLTLRGVDVSGARIGERWHIGTTVVQVTAPRTPCSKLAYVMDDPLFVKAFGIALRPGAYLRVIERGTIAAGDRAEVLSRPAHELTVAGMANIFLFDRAGIPSALAVPELPDFLREWALEHRR